MSETILTEPASLDIVLPPTQDELPYDDGIPRESKRRVLQMQLLMETLRLCWLDRQDFYVGGNMFEQLAAQLRAMGIEPEGDRT